MGINYTCKTKAKASLRLYNQISSFLFEQEFGELKDNPKAKLALQGNDTIINGKGFYVSGENKLTLDCYNNKQVDNLLTYYKEVSSL